MGAQHHSEVTIHEQRRRIQFHWSLLGRLRFPGDLSRSQYETQAVQSCWRLTVNASTYTPTADVNETIIEG